MSKARILCAFPLPLGRSLRQLYMRALRGTRPPPQNMHRYARCLFLPHIPLKFRMHPQYHALHGILAHGQPALSPTHTHRTDEELGELGSGDDE